MSGALHLAEEAEKLVGCRFRLHGRDPASGLDCVGVLAVALERAGYRAPLPTDYTLKSRAAGQAIAFARNHGFRPVSAPPQPGDILLLRVGPEQLHFIISARAQGFIHAHAGLRRVVFAPALPDGAIVGHWRAPSL